MESDDIGEQNNDDLIALGNNIGILSAGFNKIASDLWLLSSTRFRDIRLPVTQEDSSFFRGKVNPVVSETLIQACCQVDGHLYVAKKSLKQGELDLNVFEGIAGINLLQAVELMVASLKKFIPWCYEGIEPAEQVIHTAQEENSDQ